MFGIGTNELLILGVVALLLFGTRLPKIARSFGQSVTEFKKGIREAERESTEDETTEKTHEET
ncbi:MAG: twin-arginine translocase TatA/TatE family subunit [Thermoguttaceae bacterium]|nr:twin-arginine translocase TatA/TatE family subunit [Thermoguttaceae bacterium]